MNRKPRFSPFPIEHLPVETFPTDAVPEYPRWHHINGARNHTGIIMEVTRIGAQIYALSSCQLPQFGQAPYLVLSQLVEDHTTLFHSEWEQLVTERYTIVRHHDVCTDLPAVIMELLL